MVIKDLKTLKDLFQKVKTPIFGVAVYAFDRLGPEEFLPQYQLLTLRDSLDTQLIAKDLPVLSLEKGMGIYHLDVERNSTSVLADARTQAYLGKFKNPLLLPYKTSERMMALAKKHGWRIAGNAPKFGKTFLGNKIKFRRILEKIGVPVPPGQITKIDQVDFAAAAQKFGLPLFLQHPLSGGGKGNFVIHDKNGFNQAKKMFQELNQEEGENEEVLVAKFIIGSSPSLTGCVTREGILSTSLQYQILGPNELYNKPGCFGLFAGHDWSGVDFSKQVENQAYESVGKVGKYLQTLGYKGIFGLDFVLEAKTEKLYLTECNPRLLGSFPTVSMAQIRNGEPAILGFHLLEFLGVNYEIDVAKVNQAMRRKRQGSQMLLHNLERTWSQATREMATGVYKLKNGKLEFERPGYKMTHLKEENEFLVTDGVPFKGSYFSANRRLVRILSLKKVLADGKNLNSWAKNVIRLVYQNLGVKPIRFRWLKKLFDPKYLLKG